MLHRSLRLSNSYKQRGGWLPHVDALKFAVGVAAVEPISHAATSLRPDASPEVSALDAVSKYPWVSSSYVASLALALRAHCTAPLSVLPRPLKVVLNCGRAVELRVVSANSQTHSAVSELRIRWNEQSTAANTLKSTTGIGKSSSVLVQTSDEHTHTHPRTHSRAHPRTHTNTKT